MERAGSSARVTPFVVDVPESTLDDLRERLANTRWPVAVFEEGWEHGTNLGYLRTLAEHWLTRYDWRKQEAAINRFSHFRADVDGYGIHFIHERGKGEHPLPLILTHGYPDSFARFLKVIPMLTDPEQYGGSPDDAFDVVVPSLPGFGFSDPPPRRGSIFQVGSVWHSLMTDVLGYERFAAHGGDWGTSVTEQLARSHADSLVGIHLTDVPFWHLFQPPKDPSRAEKRFLDASTAWQKKEGAYALIQGTRPYSLGRGLQDSPTGLAAWIVDKFQAWSDCGGDVERRFTKDELLTNVMIYWVTATIESSFLPYYDFMNSGATTWIVEAFKNWVGSSRVPAAFARFPKDISDPPREWAERFFNVQRWTEMPSGGHFAAMEEPERLVDDIRTFFRSLRSTTGRDEGQADQLGAA
jgi:pimeloyl-ACP methyl ester carboxylesterase